MNAVFSNQIFGDLTNEYQTIRYCIVDFFEGHKSSRVPNDKIFLVNVKCKIFMNAN